MKRRPTTLARTFVLVPLFWTAVAFAQAPVPPPQAPAPIPSPPAVTAPAVDSATPEWDFRKGGFELRLLGGGALPINYKDSTSDRKMWMMAVEVGRFLTTTHGPGPFAGQLEYVVQAEPVFTRGPDHFGAIGLTPLLLRWNFAGSSQIRPTFEAGTGPMLVNWAISEEYHRLVNFYEQIGFGVRIGRPSKTGFVAGLKYQHISNGGRTRPSPGTDTYLLYGGVSFMPSSPTSGATWGAGSPAAPGARSQSEPTWPAHGLSLSGGTGLIRAVNPDTLEPGKWEVALLENNYDRNPGDIDIVKFGFQFAIGVTKRAEVFVDYTAASRSNAVNLNPVTFPVPPLDLLIDTYPTAANRSEPYFLFVPEVAYKTYDVTTVRVVPPSWGAFSQSSGNIVVGGKVSVLSERRGSPLGFGIHGYVAIPTEHPEGNTPNWANHAGVPGGVDLGLGLAFSKQLEATEFVANVGYRFAGTPSLGGMRVQYVDSSRAGTPGFLVGQPTTVPLKLRGELSLTGGARLPIFRIGTAQTWVIGELTCNQHVGSGTPVERIVDVVEVRTGLQAEIPGYRNLMVGAAWQYPLTDMGSGDVRITNFRTPDGRGDINFGQLVDPALASTVGAYFAQNGVTLASNSSKVFATNNAAFDGWRNVPTTPQAVTAAGNNAIVAFITWRLR